MVSLLILFKLSCRVFFAISAIALVSYPIVTSSEVLIALVYVPSLLLGLCVIALSSELILDRLADNLAEKENATRCRFGLGFCCLHNS